MKREKLEKQYSSRSTVVHYGADILDSEEYVKCAECIQHGNTSVREHEISVALACVNIARHLPLKFDYRALVRGSLLHDFFLYDWHDKNKNVDNHALNHASYALRNAAESFSINPIEADMIRKHMFPLNLAPPKYRETFILTLSDKIVTIAETLNPKSRKKK